MAIPLMAPSLSNVTELFMKRNIAEKPTVVKLLMRLHTPTSRVHNNQVLWNIGIYSQVLWNIGIYI